MISCYTAVFAHQLPNWHCTFAQEDNIIKVPLFFKSLSGVVSLCYKIMSIQGGLEVYLTRMFMCSKIVFDLPAKPVCRKTRSSMLWTPIRREDAHLSVMQWRWYRALGQVSILFCQTGTSDGLEFPLCCLNVMCVEVRCTVFNFLFRLGLCKFDVDDADDNNV